MSSSISGFPLLRVSARQLHFRSSTVSRPIFQSIAVQQCAYSTSSTNEQEGEASIPKDQLGTNSGIRNARSITPAAVPRRIHILGLGSLGKLVAYHLAGLPNRPPVSLLFHRKSTSEAWEESGEAIEIERFGRTDRRTGFDHENASPQARMQKQAQSPIDNLIVTLKGPMTAKALSSIAHRITPQSTIVFLQNGMGILEEVNEHVFSDGESRPNYISGIVTHGVYSKSLFKAEHAGQGTIALSVLPRVPFEELYSVDPDVTLLPPSSRYLIRTLTRTPALAAVPYPPQELFQLQLEKLAINAVVNPLTAILGCYNGELLDGLHATRTMRLLLAEISLVIRNLPELQGQPNIENRFSPERLENRVVTVLQDTARNLSSMLQDVRKSQVTEIAYMNGWVVRKGEDMGFRCIVNYAIMQLLETKSWLTFKNEAARLPFEGPE